jgi:hypothetical protein
MLLVYSGEGTAQGFGEVGVHWHCLPTDEAGVINASLKPGSFYHVLICLQFKASIFGGAS